MHYNWMRVRPDSGLDMSLAELSCLIDIASRPQVELSIDSDIPAKLNILVGVTTSVVGVSKLVDVLVEVVVVVVSLFALFFLHMALWASRMNSSCSFCCWSLEISCSRVAFFSSQSSVSLINVFVWSTLLWRHLAAASLFLSRRTRLFSRSSGVKSSSRILLLEDDGDILNKSISLWSLPILWWWWWDTALMLSADRTTADA